MDAGDVIIHGAAGLVIAFIGSVVISVIRTPKLLDDDRDTAYIAVQSTIQEQVARITALETKPPRTASEQHHYEIAKAAIQKHGETGITVLRHLKLHGQVVFGDFHSVQPPAGMDVQSFRSTLNALTGSHVVVMATKNTGAIFEYVYTLAPGVDASMEELLYPSRS